MNVSVLSLAAFTMLGDAIITPVPSAHVTATRGDEACR
jgi:hypothetical protein